MNFVLFLDNCQRIQGISALTMENRTLKNMVFMDIKNRLLDSVEEGEGGMIWENGIETCILSYVK